MWSPPEVEKNKSDLPARKCRQACIFTRLTCAILFCRSNQLWHSNIPSLMLSPPCTPSLGVQSSQSLPHKHFMTHSTAVSLCSVPSTKLEECCGVGRAWEADCVYLANRERQPLIRDVVCASVVKMPHGWEQRRVFLGGHWRVVPAFFMRQVRR